MPSFDGKAPERTFEPVAEGDYDVVLTMEWKMAGTAKVINCTYRIRDNLNQPNAGRLLFDTIWPLKEDPTNYDTAKINAILSTIQPVKDEQGNVIEEVKTNFETYDDLIQYLNGRAMIIHTYLVDKDKNDPSQGKKNAVDKFKFKPSPYPIFVNQNGQPFGTKQVEEKQDITVDDLPF